MAEQPAKPKINIIEMAKKKRHIHLLEKVQQGKSLSRPDVNELRKLEEGEPPAGIAETQEQTAKAFGVSVRTVQHWQRDGMPVTRDGRYNIADIQSWRFVHRNKKSPKSIPGINKLEEWDAKYREFKARRGDSLSPSYR